MYSCRTVTNIKIDSLVSEMSLKTWCEIFPNVKELILRCFSQSFELTCKNLWESYSYWGRTLEMAEIETDCDELGYSLKNFDAIFAGLNEEEVAILQEMDSVSLRKLNRAPVQPALTSFSGKY